MSETVVKNYYTGYVRKEWRRLVKDAYHRLEFETTLHFLKKHFPRKGLILDAGGGPGRYTVTLASQGYDLIMLDMTPANVAFAKRQIKRSGVEQHVKDVVEGSIVDLARFSGLLNRNAGDFVLVKIPDAAFAHLPACGR